MRTGGARLLGQEEYGKTRKLWEEIFTEDSREFLDYYYKYCTAENRIYGIEGEDGALLSMAQFNPYEVCLGGMQVQSDYIVAVATDPGYRHQGLMSQTLLAGMQESHDRGEPFVFLMPAAEAIYRPFDFRTVYGKNQMWVESGMILKGVGLEARPVRKDELHKLSVLSNELLQERFDIYVRRTPAYFEKLKAELASENGEMIGFFRGEALAGYCCMAFEKEIQVWELLAREEAWDGMFEALFAYFDRKRGKGRAARFHASAFPKSLEMGEVSQGTTIMVRIVDLKALLSCLRSDRETSFTIRVEDGILTQNSGVYQVSLNQEHSKVHRLPMDMPKDWIDGIFTVGELTEALFGEKAGQNALGLGIRPFERIFLNEIV